MALTIGTCPHGRVSGYCRHCNPESIKFISGDKRYTNGAVPDLQTAMALARTGRMESFKIYSQNGNFISEYALFDGKYRKLQKKENRNEDQQEEFNCSTGSGNAGACPEREC